MKYEINGLDLFAKTFENFTDNYIVVGGTACYLNMDKAGLDFRSTKDIDMIITIEELSVDFGNRFWEFIKNGGYEIYQKDGKSKFYRFLKPKNTSYPYMLELFSRKQEVFSSDIVSTFTPIIIDENGEISSLSAILLDDYYYSFLKTGKEIVNGISILKPEYLIAFKAKAFVDLYNKKQRGEQVKSEDIKKHKYDVFRLAQLLTGEEKVEENENVKKDIRAFFEIVNQESVDMKQLRIKSTKDEESELIKTVFKI